MEIEHAVKGKYQGKWATSDIYFCPAVFGPASEGLRDENVISRRVAVCEIDGSSIDEQIARVEKLPESLKPHVKCFSGSKSLHLFWRFAEGTPWEVIKDFQQAMCVYLKGDPKVTTAKSQRMRLPINMGPLAPSKKVPAGRQQLPMTIRREAPSLEEGTALGRVEELLEAKGFTNWRNEFARMCGKSAARNSKKGFASGAYQVKLKEMNEEYENHHWDPKQIETAKSGKWNGKVSDALCDLLPKSIADKVAKGAAPGERNDAGMSVTLNLAGVVRKLQDLGLDVSDGVKKILKQFADASDALGGEPMDRERLLAQYEGALEGEPYPGRPLAALLGSLHYHTGGALGERAQEGGEHGLPGIEALAGSFRILGWSEDRQRIHYQRRGIGQISAFRPSGSIELLKLADKESWEDGFQPLPTEQNPNPKTDWLEALDAVIQLADAAGVFNLSKLRGEGVWIDNGLPVWHLGDRLEVAGQLTDLDAFAGQYCYSREVPLAVDPEAAPLSDEEGVAILEVIQGMGWEQTCDGLHLAGWAVLSNVGGALRKRPALQITGSSGIGKSDSVENVLQPLQAELARYSSGSTEAGVRQMLGNSSLPALIDESEQEDLRRREQQLRLARYSYDGVEQVKGTPTGAAMRFAVRSSLCLIGINATVPNPADRNRLAVVTRRHLTGAEWKAVATRRSELITREAGERLIRRTVTHLEVLLHNVQVFSLAVQAMGGTARNGDTYGALLAGAHLLVSTDRLEVDSARAWVKAQGWSLENEAAESCAAASEAERCLQHLLGFEVRFHDGALAPTGCTTVRELVRWVGPLAGTAKGAASYKEAQDALGRLGLKVDKERGLVIATGPKTGMGKVFNGTKWANEAFAERLLDLEGAQKLQAVARFPVIGVSRGVSVPLDRLGGVEPGCDEGGEAPPPVEGGCWA